MKIIIDLPQLVYNDLRSHLIPENFTKEEAAFVFADIKETDNEIVYYFKDWIKACPSDFEYRSAYYIQLTDDFKQSLLKRAHAMQASVIEFHSHVDQELARFSPTDWEGFSEFVPHMFWRLSNRPYAAIVVTKKNFDGLCWIKDPNNAQMLDAIHIDKKILTPTNQSYKKYVNEKPV